MAVSKPQLDVFSDSPAQPCKKPGWHTNWHTRAPEKPSTSRHDGINFGPSDAQPPTVSRMNIEAILQALDAGLDLEQGITDERGQYRAASVALRMGLR